MRCGGGDSLPIELTPDYGKTKLNVYRDAARYALHEGGIGRLFGQIHHWAETDIYDQYWPSWVPKWDKDRLGDHEASSIPDLFNPAKGLSPIPICLADETDENVVATCGLVADTIEKRTSTLIFSHGLKHRQEWILDAKRIASSHKVAQDTLASTLVAGANSEHQRASLEEIRNFDAWWSTIFESQQLPADLSDLPQDAPRQARAAANFELAFSYASRTRRLFSTTSGRLGIGPSVLENSDIVAVLYGGKTPFVLRPIEFGYKIMGQCYVHGIMHGEAVQEQCAKPQPSIVFKIR